MMKTPLGPTFSGFSEPPSQLGLSQFQQSPFSKNPPPPSPSYPVPLRNFPSTDTLTLRAGCESPALFAVFRTEVSLPYCSSSNKTCLAVFNKHQVQNFSPTQMRESSGWNHQKAQIPTPRASGGGVPLFFCRQGTGLWPRLSLEHSRCWENLQRINSGSGRKITNGIHCECAGVGRSW